MIEIHGWARNAKDYSGRTLKEVVYLTINGIERPMGFADLKRAIKMNLEDRSDDQSEKEMPLITAIENGRS